MPAVVLADNAYGTLNAAISTTDSAIALTSGHGARFPVVVSTGSGAAPLYACLINSGNILEEIKITAHVASSDTVTIARAVGSTTAKAWNAGDRIETRVSSSVLHALDKGFISVKDPAFGALGDGATDDTAAFAALTTTINAMGGGTVVIPRGTYNVTPVISGVLCAFANLSGLTVLAAGAIINDAQIYSGTQVATLFQFTACKNVHIPRGLRVQSQQQNIGYASSTIGLTMFTFLQGCEGIDLDLELDGGLYGVSIGRLASDPDSYISKQVRCRLKANRVHYPYHAPFSGHGADVWLNTVDCGRNFFIYGTKQNSLHVISKNQKVTSLIKAYSGLGCEDIAISYYDRDSDSCAPSAPVIGIEWGDSTTAAHRNLDIKLNVKNPSGAPWGNTIEFNKYSDGGSSADVTGRTHLLDGFRLSGTSDNTGTTKNHVALGNGAFAAPDVFRNICCEDMSFLGNAEPAQFPLAVLADEAVFKNVRCEHNIYTRNTTNGKVVFIGCKALNFVASASNTDRHDYLSSDIVNGTDHATATNKTLINTYLAGVLVKTDTIVLRATKTLTGDLTGTSNIFLVSPAVLGMYFRLKYFLCADVTDFNPVTRSETAGIKSFSATMNSSGTWAAQQAVANDVTERTLNTASVMTVSLVNGSAAGGYIAVTCTNYNGASAAAQFELEAMSSVNVRGLAAA